MGKSKALLVMAGAGAALAWWLDGKSGGARREQIGATVGRLAEQARGLLGGGTADLVAPPTSMSGPLGAGRPEAAALSSPESTDDSTVHPTPTTAGRLPLTEEAAGGHQMAGGGPAATPAAPTS